MFFRESSRITYHIRLSNVEVNYFTILSCTLKAHRYLDGQKIYKLHPLHSSTKLVDKTTADYLKKYRLIDSNKKFPAVTYLLTDKGKDLANSLTNTPTFPLSARNYVR